MTAVTAASSSSLPDEVKCKMDTNTWTVGQGDSHNRRGLSAFNPAMSVTLIVIGTVAFLSVMSLNLTSAQWSSSIGWGGAGNGKRSSDLRSLLRLGSYQIQPKTDSRSTNLDPDSRTTNPCLNFQQMKFIGNLAEAASDRLKLCCVEVVLDT